MKWGNFKWGSGVKWGQEEEPVEKNVNKRFRFNSKTKQSFTTKKIKVFETKTKQVFEK